MTNSKFIPEQSNILWSTSWITLYPTLTAFHQKKYDLAFCTGFVFLTSINFWRNPCRSWRLILDTCAVKSVFLYQFHVALKEKKYIFFIWSSLGIMSYYIGDHFFYKNNDIWGYTYFHMGLHLLANLGNFSLLD